MKTSLLIILAFILLDHANCQLTTYPGLPGNHLKSGKYTVNVKLENDNSYTNTYVYQYLVNVGTSSGNNVYDPYNISTQAKRDALTNNHWTTVSYNNNGAKLLIEVQKESANITSCQVRPLKYGIQATISNGKAYIEVDTCNTYLYLVLNNDKKDPLFIFVDPQEKDVPVASTSTIQYFGPGIHNIGEKYTFPAGKNEIYIAGGAYLKGTIYANNKSNIKVRGRGIISGEGYNYRSGSSGIPWCAIMFEGSGTNQVVEGITSMKPIHFHILSRGTLKTSNVKCFSYNNTTDGWGGSTNSELENSFFKVNDDVTKLYANNMKLRNIICYHQTNTPIFEFGWGGQQAQNCIVDGLDIVEDNHVDALQDNGGIIGWASSSGNKNHSGHIFRNFRSDCKVNFIFHIDNKATDVCQFTCENWELTSTRIKSTPTSTTNVTFKCVKIAGSFITASEMNAGGTMSFNNSACISSDIQQIESGISHRISTYPNPFTDKLFVKSTSNDVSIYSISGEKILLDMQETENGFMLDTRHLQSGIYLIINGSEIVKAVKY